MLRLDAAISSLEAVEINLQAALTYLDRTLRDATEIDAKVLVAEVEAVKAYLLTLHPCVDAVATLKTLSAEYAGSLEDIERKLRATEIVESIVGLNSGDKSAAITSVTAVLAGLNVTEAAEVE